jgi:hypothetical protein
MTYSKSWVDLCNRALDRLGMVNQHISSLTETSREAAYCSEFLPDAVEAVLGAWDWHCARKRQVLTPDVQKPAFGWANSFVLPIDCARIVEITSDSYAVPYEAETSRVLSDADSLNLVYISKPETPNLLIPSVRRAISITLAYFLSTAMTGDNNVVTVASAEMTSALELAKQQDSRSNYDPQAAGADWYDKARYEE